MAMFFCVFFWILCVQCPQTMDQVWIAALRADAEDDGYGEVCPNGQMPWPFFVHLGGRDAAGGTTGAGAGGCGRSDGEGMAENGQQRGDGKGMAGNGQPEDGRK